MASSGDGVATLAGARELDTQRMSQSRESPAGTIWSIGHSNHAYEVFEGLLAGHGIETVADLRAFPASRRLPHFNREAMAARLEGRGIAYRWLPALGGRQNRARADSPHRAWAVAAFRNYADHMETEVFGEGLAALMDLARERPTAFLCAEALYWRCHRRLVADKLATLGWHVLHIRGREPPREHELTPFLRIIDGRLLYDGEGGDAQQGRLPFP
jgi:uncharacterized protein (DUF488 family)